MKKGATPSVEKVALLCDALDLEFYIGPRREVTPTGFAEATAAAFTRAGAPEAVTNAFEKGYLPFPWHNLARPDGPPPVLLSLAWLEANDLKPDHLSFAEIPEPGPTLALIDSRTAHYAGLAMWVWQENIDQKDILRIEWAMRNEDGPMIIFPDADIKRPITMAHSQVKSLRFLGRAVWASRLEPFK